MRIALLSRWYWEENRRYGEGGGGPVRQLAEAVAALDNEVVVLSQSASARGLAKEKIGPLEVWLSPREQKRNFLTGLRDKWAKQMYRHRKVHSDAMALQDFLTEAGPFDALWAQTEEPDGLVAAIARLSGARTRGLMPPVLTQIQSLRYNFHNGVPVFAEKRALGLAFRHSTRVIANSELVANALGAYAGRGLSEAALQARTKVVYPNLSHQFLRAAEEMTTQPVPPSPQERILFLGALNEKKGALVFMEALAKTEAVRRGAIFVVIGDYTEKNPEFVRRWEAALKASAPGLAREQVQLLGKVSPFDVIREIRLARVVVIPSLFDEFSRALVETLVLGRPVITTDRTGTWPLVEKHGCGLVTPPNDAGALAKAIDAALDPAAPYAENAQKLAHRLLHEISPGAIARQLVHHLEEMVS